MVTSSMANLFYMVMGSLFFLVFTPLTLKVLGSELYGLWIIMMAILQFAGLANFGFGDAITKYVAEYSVMEDGRDKISAAITFSYLFMTASGLAASAVVWLIRDILSSQITAAAVSRATIGEAIGITSLSLMPLFLSQLSKGILYGLVKNEVAGALDFAQNVLLWLGAFLVGVFHGGLLQLGIYCAGLNVLLFIISTIVAYAAVRKFHIFFNIDGVIIRQYFSFSFFSWVSSLGIAMFQSLDKMVVGMTIGPVAAGVYAIGTSVALRLNMLAGQFTQVLTPFASSYQAKDRQVDIKSVYQNVTFFVACLMSLCSGLLFIWMDVILKYWIGPSFSQEYSLVFRLLIIAYAVTSLSRTAHQTLSGMGEVNIPALAFVVSGAFSLVVLGLLASAMGLVGAAVANMAYVVILFLNYYLAKKLALSPLKLLLYDIALPFLVIAPVYLFSFNHSPWFFRIMLSLVIVAVMISMLYQKFKVKISEYLTLFYSRFVSRFGAFPQK